MRSAGFIVWIYILMLLPACNYQDRNPNARKDTKAREGPAPLPSSQLLNSEKYISSSVPLTLSANSQVTIKTPPDSSSEADYYIPNYIENLRKASFSRNKLIEGSLPFIHHDKSIPSVRNQYSRQGNFLQNSNSEDKYLSLQFDNDIFDNTDYYYTSGLNIELFHPALSAIPLYRVLISGPYGSRSYYSIGLIQNLYTPIDPDNLNIQMNDRPFSSYLYIGLKKISNDFSRKLRINSGIDLGVIGPAALGGYLQKAVHQIEPLGWVNQISNDVVVNYNLNVEKGILSSKQTEIILKTGFQAGTLYDNLNGAVLFRFGHFNPYFASLFPNTSHGASLKNRLRYYCSLSAEGKLVAYDATLQGGIFNQESHYLIPANNIERFVFHAKAGFGIGLGKISLEAEQVYLTPEFSGGRSHLWFRIRTTYSL